MKKLIFILMINSLFSDVETQSNNKDNSQITALTSLESIAEYLKKERILAGTSSLALSILYTSYGKKLDYPLITNFGIVSIVVSIIQGFVIETLSEKKYNSTLIISNHQDELIFLNETSIKGEYVKTEDSIIYFIPEGSISSQKINEDRVKKLILFQVENTSLLANDREALARKHLMYLAEKRKKKRETAYVSLGLASSYLLLTQPIKKYEQKKQGLWDKKSVKTNKSSPLNTFYGLGCATLSLYNYKVLSKEEKVLAKYLNQ